MVGWQVETVSPVAAFHLTLTDALKSEARHVLRGPYTEVGMLPQKLYTPLCLNTPPPLYTSFHDSALPLLDSSLFSLSLALSPPDKMQINISNTQAVYIPKHCWLEAAPISVKTCPHRLVYMMANFI